MKRKFFQVETSGGQRRGGEDGGGGGQGEGGHGPARHVPGALMCPDFKQVTGLYYTKLQT